MQDAVAASRDGPITSVTVLRVPFAALPSVQLVLRAAHIVPGWLPVPIDLRHLGRDFCTLAIPSDSSAYEAAFRATQVCTGLPHRFAPSVAREQICLDSLGRMQGDPFAPGAVLPVPGLVASYRGVPGSSGSESSNSQASSSDDTTTPHFVQVAYEEHTDDLCVAYHSPGLEALVLHHRRISDMHDILRAAAQIRAAATGIKHWKSHLVPHQPHVAGVDLHCVLLPAGEGYPEEAVIADMRGIFAPSMGAFAAIPFIRAAHNLEHDILERVQSYLLDAALAEPPQDFILQLSQKGGLVAYAQAGAIATYDTLEVALSFPGLRQTLMCASHTSQLAAAPLTGMPSTSSTTTFMHTESGHAPDQTLLGARNPLICRIGLQGHGIVSVEFPGNPDATQILEALWAELDAEGHDPQLRMVVPSCQPAQRVAFRELLISTFSVDQDRSVGVWVDLRPSGKLTYVQLPIASPPPSFAHEDTGIKGWFLNGVRWVGTQPIPPGSYATTSIVSQAPDLRPAGYFADRISGLVVCGHLFSDQDPYI